MFWKNISIRIFWGMLFLVILLVVLPPDKDKGGSATIVESENIFDFNKIFPSKKTINLQTPFVNTGILEEIKNNYEMHGSAEDRSNKYIKLCYNWSSLCDKIAYNDVSDKDKYFYQGIINLIISRKDSFSTLGVNNTLRSIKVDSSKGDRRGFAGRSKIYLHPKEMGSYREFLEVLTHEVGHVMDLGVLQGSELSELDKNYTEFSKPAFYVDDPSINFYKISRSNENTTYKMTSYKDFVSGYSMTNPFEDFAESNNMYINHQDVFAKMSETNSQIKLKYDFFKNLYNSDYLQNDSKNLIKISKNNIRRPRDTTRIR